MPDLEKLVDDCQSILAEINCSNQLREIHAILTAIKGQTILSADKGLIHYRPKHLTLQEVFPKQMLPIRDDILWRLWNPKALWTADRIRELYGERFYVNINEHQFRGFRPTWYKEGAELSQHRLANALDYNLETTPARDIRSDILANPDQEEFKYITCLEKEIPWVHMDFRNHDKEKLGILLVQP